MKAFDQFQFQTTRASKMLMLGHDKKFREVAEELNGAIFIDDESMDRLWSDYKVMRKQDLVNICFDNVEIELHNTFVKFGTEEKTNFDFEVSSTNYEGKENLKVCAATMMVNGEVVGEFYYAS